MVQPTTQPTPSHCITSVHHISLPTWACWLVSNPSIQKPHLHLRSCHIQPPLVSSPVSHHLPLPYTTFPKPPYAANTRCAIPHTYPAASTRTQQQAHVSSSIHQGHPQLPLGASCFGGYFQCISKPHPVAHLPTPCPHRVYSNQSRGDPHSARTAPPGCTLVAPRPCL